MEGPHGELGARLADGLGRDDPDRLADIDRSTSGEVAPVAFAANAMLALADQRRADAHRLDPDLVDPKRLRLVDQKAFLGDHVAGLAVDDVLRRRTAEDPVAQ